MNLETFFSICEDFDWDYLMSDDPNVYRLGRQGEDRLIALADTWEKRGIMLAFKTAAYSNSPKPTPPLTGQKDQDHMKKREVPQAAPVAEPVVGQSIYYFHPDEGRMLEAKIESITAEEIVTTFASLDRATDKFHVTRPDGDAFTEKSVFEGQPVLAAAPAPAPKLASCLVEGMKKASQYNLALDTAPYRSKSKEPVAQAEPTPAAPTQQPEVITYKPEEAKEVVQQPQTTHEVAVPTQGSWFGGIGLNPEALRERPRITFGQAVAMHMEKGIRLGDLAMNEMILSSINATGPNGMGKEGDRSNRQVNFFVLFVRAGKVEDIPYSETEANPELRPQIAYTAEELNRIVQSTKYPMKDFADVYVLVEQPEGIEDTSGVFSVVIAGKKYAPAVMKARNSSYRSLLTPISTIAESHKGKLPFFRFGITLRLFKGKQMISVPDVARLGFIGEGDRAKLAELSASLVAAMTTTKPTVDDDTPAT